MYPAAAYSVLSGTFQKRIGGNVSNVKLKMTYRRQEEKNARRLHLELTTTFHSRKMLNFASK